MPAHSKPSLLPEHAEGFLADLHDVTPTQATERTYRTALANLQRFAVETGLANRGTPLAPDNISAKFLASYYSWMAGARYERGYRPPLAKTGQNAKPKRTRKPQPIQHDYRPATIQLYLTCATQYLRWLSAEVTLPDSLTVEKIEGLLSKKVGGRRRGRVMPDRRSSDLAVGALLDHYPRELIGHAQEHGQDEDQETFKRRRLILLRNAALLHTLFSTAGRAAEVAQLQKADVASGDATWVWIKGKGGKERNLFLSSDARLAIQRYLAERHDSAAALFISHGPFGNAETAITTKTMWAIVNDACKAVFGVDDNGRPLRRAGPHAFRHLRAQLYSDEGLSITSLQATLGHASIETTRRTYAPKTPNPKLADELGTYGLPSAEVIARGEQALRRHQDDSKEG